MTLYDEELMGTRPSRRHLQPVPEDAELDVNDHMLLAAIRKRILDDIQGTKLYGGGGDKGAASIVNNVYGHQPVMPGVYDQMAFGGGGGGQGGEDPFDYLVDIERRDLPEINEATGKPAGWTKSVRRSRVLRDDKKKAY